MKGLVAIFLLAVALASGSEVFNEGKENFLSSEFASKDSKLSFLTVLQSNSTQGGNSSAPATTDPQEGNSPVPATNNSQSENSTAPAAGNSTSDSKDNSDVSGDGGSSENPDSKIVCPAYKCANKTDSTCYKKEDTSYVLSKCPHKGECEGVSFSSASGKCVAQVVADDTYQCISRSNNTGNCSVSKDCKPSHYCNNKTCEEKLSEGSSCSEYDSCKDGTICSQGFCIAYFSVQPTGKASSALACTSGIILNGTCQYKELTNGTVPKRCANHSDCLATNGVTKGECVCVNDEAGSSYCKLHRTDEISLRHLKVSHEGHPELVHYWTYVYNNYPAIFKAGKCYKKVAKELKDYEVLGNHAEKCIASAGRISFLSVALAFLAFY